MLILINIHLPLIFTFHFFTHHQPSSLTFPKTLTRCKNCVALLAAGAQACGLGTRATSISRAAGGEQPLAAPAHCLRWSLGVPCNGSDCAAAAAAAPAARLSPVHCSRLGWRVRPLVYVTVDLQQWAGVQGACYGYRSPKSWAGLGCTGPLHFQALQFFRDLALGRTAHAHRVPTTASVIGSESQRAVRARARANGYGSLTQSLTLKGKETNTGGLAGWARECHRRLTPPASSIHAALLLPAAIVGCLQAAHPPSLLHPRPRHMLLLR